MKLKTDYVKGPFPFPDREVSPVKKSTREYRFNSVLPLEILNHGCHSQTAAAAGAEKAVSAAGSNQALHGEHTGGSHMSYHWITNGREKFIWLSETGREQFFDLTSDPQELHDLINAKSHKKQIKRFREQLIQELTGREEGYVRNGQLIPGCTVQPCLKAQFQRT